MFTLVTPRTRFASPDLFENVRQELRDAFDSMWSPKAAFRSLEDWGGISPRMAVFTGDNDLVVEFDVPGYRMDELDVSIHEGKLWVHGERKADSHASQCLFDERTYGRFERTYVLPDTVDPADVQATLDAGVLSIKLRVRPEAQPHRIAIKAGGSEHARLAE